MEEHPVPQRQGVAVNFTLSTEAMALLQELAPSKKHKGTFISALLLAERARRLEHRRLREAGVQLCEAPEP